MMTFEQPNHQNGGSTLSLSANSPLFRGVIGWYDWGRSALSLSSLANENLEEEVTGGKSQARREVRRGDDDAIQGKYETRVSR